MNSLMFKYPLDYNGTNPQNGVSIPVKLSVGNPNRAEVLPYGPMFGDTVRVTEAGKPATPLTRGKDYQLIITNPELIKRCRGREIVHGIVIFNEKISDQIVIGGQIVGGPYGANLEAIEQIVDAINADTRKIKWSDLRNVPEEFIAAPAYYDVGDVYGFEYIVMAMGQIEQAIRLKDNAEMVRIQEMIAQMREELLTMFKTHVDVEGNVHKLTRTQLNVYSTGQVDNIFSEAINRFNTLMVELGKLDNVDKTLSQRIDGVITSTSNYISQIVESNLEHQKNTLEIARVSEGLALANKRINDAFKEIGLNKNNIATLQTGLVALNKSLNDSVTSLNKKIDDLENSVSSAIDDIHRRLDEIESKKVGETYIQFPGFAAPAELFGGRWRSIFDNEGVFFRTGGGGALPFNSGIQEPLVGEHKHSMTFKRTGKARNSTATVLSYNENLYGNITYQSSTDGEGIGSETRPINRTIRVWLRY